MLVIPGESNYLNELTEEYANLVDAYAISLIKKEETDTSSYMGCFVTYDCDVECTELGMAVKYNNEKEVDIYMNSIIEHSNSDSDYAWVQMIKTLVHERRHVYQYTSWTKDMFSSDDVPYRERAQEVDAYDYADTITDKYFDDIYAFITEYLPKIDYTRIKTKETNVKYDLIDLNELDALLEQWDV